MNNRKQVKNSKFRPSVCRKKRMNSVKQVAIGHQKIRELRRFAVWAELLPKQRYGRLIEKKSAENKKQEEKNWAKNLVLPRSKNKILVHYSTKNWMKHFQTRFLPVRPNFCTSQGVLFEWVISWTSLKLIIILNYTTDCPVYCEGR